MHDLHEGLGDDLRANTLAAHREHVSTYQKLVERFYWHSMVKNVKEYVKNCKNC